MKVEKECLNDFYSELSDNLGEQVAISIFKLYGGLTINIPQKLYDSKKISKYLRATFSEENLSKEDIRRMVHKFGYSERHVRRLLKK